MTNDEKNSVPEVRALKNPPIQSPIFLMLAILLIDADIFTDMWQQVSIYTEIAAKKMKKNRLAFILFRLGVGITNLKIKLWIFKWFRCKTVYNKFNIATSGSFYWTLMKKKNIDKNVISKKIVSLHCQIKRNKFDKESALSLCFLHD